jgi:ankyrin repeat protein
MKTRHPIGSDHRPPKGAPRIDQAPCVTRRGLVVASIAACFAPPLRAGSYEDFFAAIDANDARKLRDVLAKGFDVNSVDPKGHRALYLAVRAGARDAFRVLMAQPGIEIDAQNAHGETALMMAALRDNLEAAQALAARGAATHKDGWAPVHYAASAPGATVLRWLLERGAPLDAKAPGGNTPLLMAARYGDERAIELLLERGADRGAKNEKAQGAVDLAREAKRGEWVKRFGGKP